MKNKILLILGILLVSLTSISATYGDYISNYSVGSQASNPYGLTYDSVNDVFWILNSNYNAYKYFGNWTYTGTYVTLQSNCLWFDYYDGYFYQECGARNDIKKSFVNGTYIGNWITSAYFSEGGYIEEDYFWVCQGWFVGEDQYSGVVQYFLNNATETGIKVQHSSWKDITGNETYFYPTQQDATYVWQIPEYEYDLTTATGRTFYPSSGDHSITQLKAITNNGTHLFILDNYWDAVFMYELNPDYSTGEEESFIQGVGGFLKDFDTLISSEEPETTITGEVIQAETQPKIGLFSRISLWFQNILNWFKGLFN